LPAVIYFPWARHRSNRTCSNGRPDPKPRKDFDTHRNSINWRG